MGFFSEDNLLHMAAARALTDGPYEDLNAQQKAFIQGLSEKVLTAVAPLSWLASGHRRLETCPGCGQGGLSINGLTSLGYEFVVCECGTPAFPHLVEQMWHREHMGRPDEAIAATARRETLHEIVQVLASAARTDQPQTPRAASFAGGLRRALRLVRQVLSETPDPQEGAEQR